MTEQDERIIALLTEIRDLQKEWMETSSRQVEQSLTAQDVALERQAAVGKILRKVILGAVILIASAVAYLTYLAQIPG